jgi:hypothetical protein
VLNVIRRVACVRGGASGELYPNTTRRRRQWYPAASLTLPRKIQ